MLYIAIYVAAGMLVSAWVFEEINAAVQPDQRWRTYSRIVRDAPGAQRVLLAALIVAAWPILAGAKLKSFAASAWERRR